MSTINRTAEKTAYLRFTAAGMTPQGSCGLIGNLEAESDGFWPNRLEYLCVKRLKENGKNYTDESYTAAIDSGEISCEEFLHPLPGRQYGYGLAQWTTPSRKSGLYNLARHRAVSIADLDMQLDYLMSELEEKFPSVLKVLKSTNSIQEASDIVLTKFEAPAGADKLKASRAERGKKFYEYMKGELSMSYTPEAVIAEAREWDGYLEKKSTGTDEQLKDKDWNPGSNNITWFWTWLARNDYGNLQGGAWCDGFVDYIHCIVAGIKKAKKSLGGFSAYTPTSAQQYKNAGRWISASGTPAPGDQIFFRNSERICHTGIVTKVTTTKVYTIEGNTSSAAGVVANGGCVREKSYDRSYSRIAGYGRPLWDKSSAGGTETSTIPAPATGNVAKGQQWFNDNYPDVIKTATGALLAIDDSCGPHSRWAALAVWKDVVNRKYGYSLTPSNQNFGASCKAAAKKAQIQKGASGTLVYIAEFILSAKGFYTGKMDAEFGSGLKASTMAFQEAVGLPTDGIIGPDTWYAMFN